jgi:hypothetical protein
MKILREYIRTLIKETYQSHSIEPKEGDHVVNINDNCKHKGSEGVVLSIEELQEDQGNVVEYQCTNDGPSWDTGDILKKTMDQLAPMLNPPTQPHAVSKG